MKKILIIEDDNNIANQIKKALINWEYEVKIVEDFENVLDQVLEFQPHLILLDLNLPSKNGYILCQEIRRMLTTPIIFISSSNEDTNVIMAINSGGDDFISKPFDLNVLVAKIKAILRRTYEFLESNDVYLENIKIDFNRYIIENSQTKIDLTKNECMILKVLFDNKHNVVTRDNLMNYLWDNESFIDGNTLNVNINRLRNKLKMLNEKELIKTKKGVGYYICEK